MKKDYNYIALLEQKISKKYGARAIQNPKSSWNEKKEAAFIQSVKKFYQRINNSKDRREEYKTYFEDTVCGECRKHHYFMNLLDEISYVQYGVCRSCFIELIADRATTAATRCNDKESEFKN